MKPTADEVLAWAREANLPSCHTTHLKALARFAALVAAAEREKCADICDHEMDSAKACSNIVYGNGMSVGAGNCADKIRALGE